MEGGGEENILKIILVSTTAIHVNYISPDIRFGSLWIYTHNPIVINIFFN